MLRYLIIGLAVVAVLYMIARRFRNQRKSRQSSYEQNRRDQVQPEDNFNTIFIAIPCYRDEHACAETLFSLFNEASCPWRLRVAVMHHAHPNDQSYGMDIANLYEHVVLRHNASSFQSKIKVVTAPWTDATGPWNARSAVTAQLFQNERFYMTVNCRTQFVRGWDAMCLDQYTRCLKLSPRPILTTLPATVNPEGTLETLPTYPRISMSGDVTAVPYTRVPVRPFPSTVVLPEFMFASSRLLTECDPSDLSIPLITNKEGLLLMSARYYTYGWDFFTPTGPLLYRIERNAKTPRLLIDRPDSRAVHEQQQSRVTGLLNNQQCRICEEDAVVHDEFIGHDFEAWPRQKVFGAVRSLDSYLKYAERGEWGITMDVTPEEQVAKFDRVAFD